MGNLSETTAGRLIELFQSAAFGLTAWDTPLSALAEVSGATIGQLAVLDDRGELVVNICSGVGEDDIGAYVDSGGPDPAVNLRTRAIVAASPLRCMVDADYTSAEELAKDVFHNEFFVPRDLPFSCLTKLFQGHDGLAGLSLLLPARTGHLDGRTRDFVGGIAPRLAEVVRGSLALARSQNGTLAALAGHVHGNVLLLGADGRIHSMTDRAERHVRSGRHITAQGGRLCCVDHRTHRAFERSLAAVAAPTGSAGSLHVDLELFGPPGAASLPAELIALPRPMHTTLLQARAVLILRDPNERDPPTSAALRHRFGLTEAEAAVCTLLASGADARQIADRRGSAIGTVRNQIKIALEKTATRRQIDLVLRIREEMRYSPS